MKLVTYIVNINSIQIILGRIINHRVYMNMNRGSRSLQNLVDIPKILLTTADLKNRLYRKLAKMATH